MHVSGSTSITACNFVPRVSSYCPWGERRGREMKDVGTRLYCIVVGRVLCVLQPNGGHDRLVEVADDNFRTSVLLRAPAEVILLCYFA